MRSLRTLQTLMLMLLMATGSIFASTVPGAYARGDQPNLKWRARQIRVALSSSLTQPSFNIKSDSDVMGAVLRSFAAWENVANIEFVTEISDKQGISQSGPAGDGVSLITIAQTPENVLLFSKEPDRESAKTRVFYNRKGFITEADIVLNPFQQFSTDGSFGTFDLQATITHEIGHMLGLKHSGVLGATMSESFSKNGTFGIPDLTARTLSKNDIAAVRELYEPALEDEACCGMVSGKLTAQTGRALKGGVRVWAEETETGRVFAQTETLTDGTYKLGGLPDATYTIFWQAREDGEASASGELGYVDIEKGNALTLNGKVTPRPFGPEIGYIGINGHLANTGVPLRSGRDHMIYLGGRNLDPKNVSITFSSAYIRVTSGPFARTDFGDAASVLSFSITIDENAPPGLYSVFASGSDGVRSSLIGALKVD